MSVAILTYNGEKYIERILKRLRQQDLQADYEVIVVDSGSTDSTLEIVARFPEVRLITIPNEEFGHGRTRNLAAQHARGEFLAFLTHDAVPHTRHWLTALIEPFDLFPQVVAVLGKQVARKSAFPLQKYEIHGMFRALGADIGTTVSYSSRLIKKQSSLDLLSYYSDVNSAVRRQFLLDVVPYRDVRYAEDQLFGKDLLAAGYMKAYAPHATVEHSNDLTLNEYGHRIFDETVGLRQIGVELPPMSALTAARFAIRGTIGDSVRISLDKAYSPQRKLYWLAVNPLYHVRKWSQYRASTLVDVSDAEAVKAGSLEHKRKTHHRTHTHGGAAATE